MNPYITPAEKKKLSRAVHPMPAFVNKAIKKQKLEAAYKARPPYQKNDYVGWITTAKRAETQHKRLVQMVRELKGGKRYMNMKYTGAT